MKFNDLQNRHNLDANFHICVHDFLFTFIAFRKMSIKSSPIKNYFKNYHTVYIYNLHKIVFSLILLLIVIIYSEISI